MRSTRYMTPQQHIERAAKHEKRARLARWGVPVPGGRRRNMRQADFHLQMAQAKSAANQTEAN